MAQSIRSTCAISESPVVRSADQEREALPVTGDEKGRCRLHGGASGSGGPPGERNGQYRHGERTNTVASLMPTISSACAAVGGAAGNEAELSKMCPCAAISRKLFSYPHPYHR
jgi:hypothetical protein